MEMRIGVTHSPRELAVDLGEGADRNDLKARVEAALSGASDVLWVTDKKGREVAVPAAKLAYVELGSDGSEPSIGFGHN